MTYQEKAFEVISRSIKSAIFIDERAREFYQSEEALKGEIEEDLSLNLYSNFKSFGISLAVHKFSQGDEKNSLLKKYLLDGRDLVLLDWKLNGEEGEEFSLQLLADIVKAPHIHYCALYTSQDNIDNIFFNILSYFSGKTSQFFIALAEKYSDVDQLKSIISNYNPFNTAKNNQIFGKLKAVGVDLDELKSDAGTLDAMSAMKYLYIAFQSYQLSDVQQPIPDLISPESHTLVIDNTVITVLKKNSDSDATNLIKRISNQIAASKTSFTQLLGLEMQSIFSSQGAFIDENLLKVSLEALLAHRNSIKAKDGSDVSFKSLIKNVLVEHATMKLRTAKLALLDEDFLDDESKNSTNPASNEALAAMNVFYNSVKVESINPNDLRGLNFGDVFSDSNGCYFICITALCDCYIPSKIDNIFYFAKGAAIPIELALTLGDTAFMSFLPNLKVISWVSPEPDQNVEIPDGTSPEEEVKLYKAQVEYYKQYKFKPVYIKPLAYNVKSPKIIDDKIEIRRVETKNDKEDLNFVTLSYVTTIRPNYTQRIANHAFSHPVRVGVDFAKST